MELTDKQIEQIALAYRNTIYLVPPEDRAWESCRENWVRDARVFLARLKEIGLEVVEMPPPPPPFRRNRTV